MDASSAVSRPSTLYTWNLTALVGKEYIPFIEDVLRMVLIQVVIQFMVFLQNPSGGVLLSGAFFELVFYLVLGVSVYWLVFKKVVALV